MLIGYARVSTDKQDLTGQLASLRQAGCTKVFEERLSGACRARPELTKALAAVGRGDVLVVARLDRLARSLSHLLAVIEDLTERGAGFRSLADTIDTTSPHGMLTLQILGAVAEFERQLIRERTMVGIEVARAKGKKPGNPQLRAGNPEAKRKIARAREQAYFDKLNATASAWLPVVRQMRPHQRWQDVASVLNARAAGGERWTVERLRRAVDRFIADGLAEPELLGKAPPRSADDRLMTLVAGMTRANPDMTLAAIGAQLEAMYERTPSGGRRWAPGSVKSLLDRARKRGLLPVSSDRA